MKLLSIIKPAKRLILIKHCAPLKSQIFWFQAGGVAALLVLLAAALYLHVQAFVIIAALLVVVALLFFASRAAEVKRAASKDESICFDSEANAILQNGEPVALISDMNHVLVRHILPDGVAEGDPVDYALVVSLANSRKITLAETYGMPGGKEEIEQAANEIARFAGVPVQVGQRHQTEYWMDMS